MIAFPLSLHLKLEAVKFLFILRTGLYLPLRFRIFPLKLFITMN